MMQRRRTREKAERSIGAVAAGRETRHTGKSGAQRKSRSPERTGKERAGLQFYVQVECGRSPAVKCGKAKSARRQNAKCGSPEVKRASRAFVYQDPQLRAFVRLDPARLNFDPGEADDVHRVLNRVIEQADVLEHEAALAVRFILRISCSASLISSLSEHRFDKLLGRRDVHLAANGKRDRVKAAFGIGEAKERTRVALGEGIFGDELSLGVAQAEKPKLIRHARPGCTTESARFRPVSFRARRKARKSPPLPRTYRGRSAVCFRLSQDTPSGGGRSRTRCTAPRKARRSMPQRRRRSPGYKLIFAEAVRAPHRQRLNDTVLRDRIGECGRARRARRSRAAVMGSGG